MTASTHATFQYIDPESIRDGKPWSKVDGPGRSYREVTIEKPVYNARDDASDFKDVDRTGFAFYTSPSQVSAEDVLADGAAVRGPYYAEVEAALRKNLKDGDKVARVYIFDHTIRVRDPQAARQPVAFVHVDQTPGAAAARVRRHLGDDAEALLQKRFQLINVWRPLGHEAADHPLGVIDWRSATKADLTPVNLLYPERNDGDDDDRGKEKLPDAATLQSTDGYKVGGETYSVLPNPKHRFYYVKDMRPDEVMFLKCFDSASAENGGDSSLAGFTPHTAFDDPNTPKDAKPRQSIEVRCLVFYE